MNKKWEKMKRRQKTVEKKSRKKGKEGPKGYHPRRAQKWIFHIRIVKRNHNEIEAPKKSDFEHPTKNMNENEWKWMKMNENERKWKKMKENDRKW